MKELRQLKKWREALRYDFEAAAKKEAPSAEKVPIKEKLNGQNDSEGSDDEDLKKLEDEIYMLKDEERRGERRAKKRALKEKRKAAERIDLKMEYQNVTN